MTGSQIFKIIRIFLTCSTQYWIGQNLLKLYFSDKFSAGKPTKVYIDLFIRTMGPVADLAYTYSFNCYFRQMWTDDRLVFNNSGIGFRQLSLSMAMLDKIWKPDTVGCQKIDERRRETRHSYFSAPSYSGTFL